MFTSASKILKVHNNAFTKKKKNIYLGKTQNIYLNLMTVNFTKMLHFFLHNIV